MNDGKLIRALRRGQRGALDRVIAGYSGYAASVARSVLGSAASREDLEEIVSDVFVALWRTADRLDETRPLKSYLAAIARNAAIDRLRRQRPEEPLPADDLLAADCSGWRRMTARSSCGFIITDRPYARSRR